MKTARADMIDGRDGGLRGDGLRWPVMCWKSPQLPATVSSIQRVYAPVPAGGAVDLATEVVTAQNGYSIGDVIRRQRGRHAGGNIAYNSVRFSRTSTIATICGNQPTYFANKATGGTFGMTATNLRNRLHGFWPARVNGGVDGVRVQKEKRAAKNATLGIVRVRAATPWISGKEAAGSKQFDMSRFGHGDDPISLELWAKCLETDLGYSGGDEILVRGDDAGGTGAGEVYHNGSTIGFYLPATGWAIVSALGVGVSSMTPSRWQFQLRAAWAGDPADAIIPPKGERERYVQWWASQWRTPKIGMNEFQMPPGFNPVNVFTSLRCLLPEHGYEPGDEYLSNHAAQLNLVCLPTIIVRGRRLIVPTHSTIAIQHGTTGAGGNAITPSKWQLQIRAIG